MFAYIKGILTHASPVHVVIEAGGVGYKIYIAAHALGCMPQINTEAILHTSFVVRELTQTLYGFQLPQERDFFEALLNVTGIGPKIAMALIGHMPIIELQKAISQSDIPALCRVPGIGKKGAERLIIEMRDKIPPPHPQEYTIQMQQDPFAHKINDAMSALIHLGYSQQAAQSALKKTIQMAPEHIDLASLITDALKHI